MMEAGAKTWKRQSAHSISMPLTVRRSRRLTCKQKERKIKQMREFYSFTFQNTPVGLLYYSSTFSGAHLRVKEYRNLPRFCTQWTYSSDVSPIQYACLLFIVKFTWKLRAILLSLSSEDAPVFYTVRKS